MSDSTLVVWDEVFTDYDFGPSHPMRPLRLALTMALSRQLGVLDRPGVTVGAPTSASPGRLAAHRPSISSRIGQLSGTRQLTVTTAASLQGLSLPLVSCRSSPAPRHFPRPLHEPRHRHLTPRAPLPLVCRP